MKVGDLIKWIDYKEEQPIEHVGLLIEKLRDRWPDATDGSWNDLHVLCGGSYVYWTALQCEVNKEKQV